MGDFLIGVMQAVFGLLFLVALWKIRHQIFTEPNSPSGDATTGKSGPSGAGLWPSREELPRLIAWIVVLAAAFAGIVGAAIAIGPETLAVGAVLLFGALALYALALPVVAYARRDRNPS